MAVFAMVVLPFGGLQLNVAEAAGVTVSGRIVSPAGDALTNAGGFVDIQPVGGGPGQGGNIENDGTFEVSGVTSGEWQVSVNFGGPSGYTGPAPFTITVGTTAVDLGDIKATNPSITGTLLEPTGSAVVTGANLNLRSQDWTVNFWSRSDETTGAFQFGGLNPGTYILTAEPPEGSAFASSETEINYTGTVITNLTVRLATPNIAGMIKNSSGGALVFPENAWMNVMLHNDDWTFYRNANVNRDTGAFVFGTVPTGTYTIDFEARGFADTAPASITVSVTSGVFKDLGDIRMTTAQITGIVTSPKGEPVQNANVQVHDEFWTVNKWANSDESGAYSIGGLSAGTYIIEVNPPWGGPAGLIAPEPSNVTVTTNGTVTKNLQFVQAVKYLTGKVSYVVGAGASAVATGGVAGARINVFKEGGFGYSNTTTDANGDYEIALSGGVWNVNVEPDMYPGAPEVDWFYAGPPLRVEFDQDSEKEDKTLDIGVEKATASIIGKVVRPDGTPVTNAWVDARNDRGAGQGRNVNPDGTFSLRVTAGAYRVGIWGDQSLTFPEQQVQVKDSETKDLGIIKASSKDARIIGKLVDANGNGLGGIRVNAFMFDQPGWSDATSEDNGEFTLAVTKGQWGVNMDMGGGGQGSSQYVYSGPPVDVNVSSDDATVSYTTDSRLIMKLTRADATISGKIVTEDGTVVTGFCAWAWAQPGESTGEDGEFFFGPRYGGPVDCQTGAFSMNVPSDVASTYTIGVDTPPNTEYSPAGNQSVAILANTTSEKNIVVKKNDATLTGKLVDQNGADVTNCTSVRGWFGDVHVFGNGGWKGGPINPDCTFSFSLLSGKYNYGWWIDDSRFLETPPRDEKITVEAGTNTLDITVLRADVTVNGTVTDPTGAGVDAFVWAGNFPEEGAGNKDIDFKEQLFTGTKTDENGAFSLGLLDDKRWEVGTGLPPGSPYMPAEVEVIDLRTQDAPSSLNLTLRQALGTMSGSVTLNGDTVPFGFVHCWSEEGGFTGGDVQGGNYKVNYVSGVWHCQADSFSGQKFYQSDEVTITIDDETEISQDFTLGESVFTVPPTVSSTFDAGNVRNIELDNGVRINIPSGALGDSGDDVTVTAAPKINVNQGKTDKLFGVGYELTALDSDGQEITAFNSNVTVTFPYTDEQLADLGVDEDSLITKYYDETTNTWKLPPGVTQNIDDNTISIQTNHFTTFGIITSAQAVTSAAGPQMIVAAARAGGGPHVTVWDSTGTMTGSFMAYATTFRGGVNAVLADIDGDGTDEVVTVPDSGGGPHVRAFEQDGTFLGDVFPYATTFRGGVSLAAGDVDGDRSDEIVVAPKSSGGPHVRVYNFTAGTGFGLHSQFNAYAAAMRTGVKVYAEDVTGDGTAEIITVPMPGAPAHVRVLNETGGLVGQFYAFPEGYRGSANLSFGDADGDGDLDIVAAPDLLGGPQIRILDGGGSLISQFFAHNSSWRMGLNAGVGDVDGDGSVEVVVGVQEGGGPQIRVFDISGNVETSFFAYTTSFRGGMTTLVSNIDGSGAAEILTVPNAGGGPHVRSFDAEGTGSLNFMSHASAFRGGVNLAVH